MEADWAVEIGAELQRIEADWAGWVDLREQPQQVEILPETAGRRALREVLLLLNDQESLVFTTKCDWWELDPAEIDPLEFAAEREAVHAGLASYVDVIARDAEIFASFERHEAWVKSATQELRAVEGRRCRADLVVRAAQFEGRAGFGVTLYAAGCGADTGAAEAAWGEALRAAATATMRMAALA